MSLPASSALQISDLTLRFRDRDGDLTALSITELQLSAGQSLVVCGPSGCGKSSLLYVLAGLLQPTQGRIAWHGEDLYALSESRRDAWRRRTVGFIFQDFELLSELSPLENVLLPASFGSVRVSEDLRSRARLLLERFEVPHRRGATGLMSRGERQRVALARALLFDPPIILADEPTASLDAVASARVISTLVDLSRESGRMVIAASHDPALIEAIPDRLALAHGRTAMLQQVPA